MKSYGLTAFRYNLFEVFTPKDPISRHRGRFPIGWITFRHPKSSKSAGLPSETSPPLAAGHPAVAPERTGLCFRVLESDGVPEHNGGLSHPSALFRSVATWNVHG